MDPYLTEFSATVFLATPLVGGWPSRFSVVTACNEHGDRDAEHANHARTAELGKVLDDAGIGYFPVTGCSPDLAHREPGFGCIVETLDQALAFGRWFSQLAVFWIEQDNLELVYVESGRRYPLGSWSARVKGAAEEA